MRTVAEGAMAPNRFEPLAPDEWHPLTSSERVVYAEEIREAEERGYWRGYLARTAECVSEHASIANRIDAAASAFYLLEADDFHRDEVGA